jgi:hypothetical protein
LENASGSTEFHFVFTVSADEDKFYRKIVAEGLKGLIDDWIVRGIPLLSFLIIIIPVGIAAYRDSLASSAPYVSELSFAAAWAGAILAKVWGTRRLNDEVFKRLRSGKITWEASFDDQLVVFKAGEIESRLPWTAISAVQAVGSIVVFWLDLRGGFYLPVRLLADTNSRDAFVAWASQQAQNNAAERTPSVSHFAHE